MKLIHEIFENETSFTFLLRNSQVDMSWDKMEDTGHKSCGEVGGVSWAAWDTGFHSR